MQCNTYVDKVNKTSKIVFDKFLSAKYEKKGEIAIDIGVKNIRMPPSTKPTGAFKI
jgi:hypothetical protein